MEHFRGVLDKCPSCFWDIPNHHGHGTPMIHARVPLGSGETLGRITDHGLIGYCMTGLWEGSRIIVWDLDGFGMESGARPGGLKIFGHRPLAWGSFFTLAAKG